MIYIDDQLNKNVDVLKTGYSNFVKVDNAIYLPPDEELADLTGTPVEVLDQYNNWYFLNGNYYYVKELKCLIALVNELLGEHLSKYMGLPTIEYDIAEREDKVYGLISKNFKKPYFDYKDGLTISRSLIRYIKRMLTDKDFECNETVRKELTSYLVRNYYASQKDRLANTLYATSSYDRFLVAPLFDYESAFIDPTMIDYIDPMITWTFTPDSVEYLRENNQYFQEYVNMIFDYRLLSALSEIEKERQIFIPSEIKAYYASYDDERKDFMKTMGLSKK